MDVAGRHVEAGRAAAEVEMMGDGGAEPDEPLTEEDGREDEHVRHVLSAVVRVVVDVEVARLQRLRWKELRARPERGADGAELHRNELRLAHDVAFDVEQCGRAVVRLAHDRRVRRPHELDSHLLRSGDEGLGDDCLIHLIERHGPCLPDCVRARVCSVSASVRRFQQLYVPDANGRRRRPGCTPRGLPPVRAGSAPWTTVRRLQRLESRTLERPEAVRSPGPPRRCRIGGIHVHAMGSATPDPVTASASCRMSDPAGSSGNFL